MNREILKLNLDIQLNCQLIKKVNKKMVIGRGTRKKLFVDESRIWNFSTNTTDQKQLRSFIFGYFWYNDIAESHFGINQRILLWYLEI